MNLFKNLFSHKDVEPVLDYKKASVFVDYEHWYYSCRNLFHIAPDPISWRKNLDEKYNIERMYIFGDFSNKGINEGLDKLHAISNTVISTQQPSGRHKKDMTDFIMLDHIYQVSAEDHEVGTYIIFTGDGHFQSVVKYLIQKLGKKVIIYGVTNATSNRLKDVATEVYEIPAPEEVIHSRYQMIVDNLAYVFDHENIIPSFKSTVAAVARRNEVPEDEVAIALQEMLEKGLLYRKERRVEFNRNVKVLAANWDALIEAGLCQP